MKAPGRPRTAAFPTLPIDEFGAVRCWPSNGLDLRCLSILLMRPDMPLQP